MTRKTDPALIDHAANLIRNGEILKVAAEKIGINPVTLSRKLSELGVAVPRGRRGDRVNLPIENIAAMYQDGKSENAIANELGVSRGTVRKRLLRVGITPRTQSEAEELKWAQMSNEARANQVKAAHKASRGVIKSIDTRRAIARTRERIKYAHLVGMGEIELLEFLTNRGIHAVHQMAVDSYNIDIAVGNIAVELTRDRGRYTMFNPKEIKRAEYLLESGYHVMAVEFDSVGTIIECADNLIRFIDEMSRLETTAREYWVVRCRRKDRAVVKNELGQFTSVPAPVEFLAERSVIKLR